MEIVIGLALNLGLPLAIVYGMHRWIGAYPTMWRSSQAPRRELIEVALFWLLVMGITTAFTLTRDPAELSTPNVGMQLEFIAWSVVPLLILPLVLVWRQGWRPPDLGLRRPTSRWMVVFALVLFTIAGVLPMLGDNPEPIPWAFLAIALYQPAFIEEFFFRVILQGKLERVVGPTRAWFWSGILFGLAHAPVDFFGPQFYANGESYVNASFLLLTQIISGWIFGLIYAKTRSILPGFLAHFMTDGRLGSVVLHLLPG